ncbi:maleylpyruvate isomerase family mycothiol-dependent enzyme [Streptomyces sp. NPDC006012]|uniref:maleylpyruvate isomerase family mycothiol-dependent enzyme n=1 Tax=Streptomyces sp. NPDC006012 TaxID=3364739 RepID=UPI003688E9B1
MPRWDLHRYRDEILTQTDLLRDLLAGADPTVHVPTCPEWNLGQLARHVGGAHRWVETIVRTRATEPVSDALVNDVFGYGDEDTVQLDAWLADGARRLADAFTDAGPDTRVWTVVPDQPLEFWARRMLFETVVHRADAARTLGVGHEIDAAVARDGLDEWMSFGTVPEAYDPGTDEPLLGAGRTLRWCAGDDPAGDWFVDLTGDVPRWRHGGDEAAVTVRGPVADLLLLVYGRPVDERTEVRGDRALLDLWLRRTGCWLHE